MKNTKFLLLIIMSVLLIPFGVFAEGEATDTSTTGENDNKVNVYFFRGEGCSHCAEAEKFFESIKEEYGQYFNLVDYETWYNTDNASLLEKVGDYLDQDIQGVPFIIIGKQTWNGYASDYDDAIKAAIKEEFAKDVKSRDDVIAAVASNDTSKKENKDYTSDIVTVIIMVLVVAGITTGIIYARKKA